jgi:hypothetical protein
MKVLGWLNSFQIYFSTLLNKYRNFEALNTYPEVLCIESSYFDQEHLSQTPTSSNFQIPSHPRVCQTQNLPIFQMSPPAAAATSDSPFCLGKGDDMFANGFHFAAFGRTSRCLNFLVPFLKMDTPLKFFWGCVSAFLIGLSVQGMSSFRIRVRKMSRGGMAMTAFYGMHMLVTYLVMCLVMTYSLEILLNITLGLCAGHALFYTNFHSGVGDDFGDRFDEGLGSGAGRYSSLALRSTYSAIDK